MVGIIIEDTLAEREKSHGSFKDVADMTQQLIEVVEEYSKGGIRKNTDKLAVEMILQKIARHTCGDSSNHDHMRDIAGYALLAEKEWQ